MDVHNEPVVSVHAELIWQFYLTDPSSAQPTFWDKVLVRKILDLFGLKSLCTKKMLLPVKKKMVVLSWNRPTIAIGLQPWNPVVYQGIW